MLQILLLILKIIGIILAVLLGIIIVLLGILLFVPIRYEASAKCDGTIDSLKLKAKVTWLLHLVRVDVFMKGTKLKWIVRLAWFKKSNQIQPSSSETKERKDEVQDGEKNETKETAKKEPQKVEDTPQDIQRDQKSESTCEERHTNETETDETPVEEDKKESINDKIKSLLEKKDNLLNFLTDKAHIHAFQKVKKELFWLLKRWKPKKIKVNLRFGFDDPSLTGKVLGYFAMIYPFLEDSVEVIPDFEKQILEGNAYLKGRIRFCHLAKAAIILLLCKDIRTSYKDIRNFKL